MIRAAVFVAIGQVSIGLLVIAIGAVYQWWGKEPSYVVLAGLGLLAGPRLAAALVQSRKMGSGE